MTGHGTLSRSVRVTKLILSIVYYVCVYIYFFGGSSRVPLEYSHFLHLLIIGLSVDLKSYDCSKDHFFDYR